MWSESVGCCEERTTTRRRGAHTPHELRRAAQRSQNLAWRDFSVAPPLNTLHYIRERYPLPFFTHEQGPGHVRQAQRLAMPKGEKPARAPARMITTITSCATRSSSRCRRPPRLRAPAAGRRSRAAPAAGARGGQILYKGKECSGQALRNKLGTNSPPPPPPLWHEPSCVVRGLLCTSAPFSVSPPHAKAGVPRAALRLFASGSTRRALPGRG